MILTVIMVLQSIWLYISEFAGKELEFIIIIKFIFYSIPISVPITLPLTILFSSIMVFGEFSEHYEFAAMKSTILFLGFATFYFSDSVIPASYQEFINLRRNVFKRKPARAIVANRFNELQEYNIKIDRKHGDNDQFLENVVIHKKTPNKKGNYTIIKSRKGELISSVDSNVLSFKLIDGNYYEELQPKKNAQKNKFPFVKSSFKEYTINVKGDLNNVTVSESDYSKNRKMRGIDILIKDVDSFSNTLNKNQKTYLRRITSSSGAKRIFKTTHLECTTEVFPESITDILDLESRINVLQISKGNVEDLISRLETYTTSVRKQKVDLNKFEIAIHEKYALGVACIVLFFIGAPIGAIIRKGGLGLPALYAFGLFLVYYFVGIFAKNTAEDGTISPFLSGILFTYRATNDKGLISLGEFFHKIVKFFKIKN